MSDLISRQAAIEAVEHITSSMSVCVNTDECHGMKRMQRQAVIELANLPSAQPEIIRCKDCKYWMPHSQLGYDEDNETYHDYCEKLIPEDEYYAFYRDADDYCSRAERRTDGV